MLTELGLFQAGLREKVTYKSLATFNDHSRFSIIIAFLNYKTRVASLCVSFKAYPHPAFLVMYFSSLPKHLAISKSRVFLVLVIVFLFCFVLV